jgi:hypothetical protein
LRTLLSDSVRFALSGSALVADIQVQPGLERIWVDEGQLGQVLHNLLINARQAIPGKGRVELRARRAEIPELGAVVRIEIEDDGPGIEKEDWDTVFEPFYSTRSEGTGLGLSIAQSVLFRHGGRILLEEGSKGGACFVLLLPDLVGSEPEEDARAATRDLPSARILVMDDEDGVREILRSMLERLGHEVTAVSDGEEALRLYREAAASGAAFDPGHPRPDRAWRHGRPRSGAAHPWPSTPQHASSPQAATPATQRWPNTRSTASKAH